MKKRVHELAKEYGMSSKDFLILLKDEIKLETNEKIELASKQLKKLVKSALFQI